MFPNDWFALLVVLALFPGWVFVRLAETKASRPERSQLAELLELAAIGFTTTAISALAIAAMSTMKDFSFLFNVPASVHTGQQYLGEHLVAALLSTILCIALSCILAFALFSIVFQHRSADFRPGSSPWIHALATFPVGMQNWVGIHRRDGSLVEGLFLSGTSGPDSDRREIALSSPIRVTKPDGTLENLNINRVLIPGEEIISITVIHVPDPGYSVKPSIIKRALDFAHWPIFSKWLAEAMTRAGKLRAAVRERQTGIRPPRLSSRSRVSRPVMPRR